jgi:hypothetical protein
MRPPLPIEAGMKFGRLVAVKRVANDARSRSQRWRFICDCGGEKITTVAKVKSGKTKSCGCWRSEWARELIRRVGRKGKASHFYRHGMSGTREHAVWCAMITRCTCPTYTTFKYYGGRGIAVCNRWRRSFANFYADMGPRSSAKHSIDRIDNDGNYKPSNCRWATKTEQMKNRRVGRLPARSPITGRFRSDPRSAAPRRVVDRHTVARRYGGRSLKVLDPQSRLVYNSVGQSKP